MPPGQFTVGRSAGCNLAIDDACISRRHVTFHVSADQAEVEDLGSRNGVLLNGSPVKGRVALRGGDRVTLGMIDLFLLDQESPVREGRDTLMDPIPAVFRKPGEPGGKARPTPAIGTDAYADETKPGSSVQVMLTTVVDKALGMGQLEEAGRVTERIIEQMRTGADRGHPADPYVLKTTTRFLLDLAERTGSGRWIDLLFEIHELAQKLPDGKTVDSLYELVHRLRYNGGASLRACLESLREKQGTYGPSERFVLRRLEGLARVTGA